MLCQSELHFLLMVSLLLPPMLCGSPVSSPEIASKSVKSTNSVLGQQQSAKTSPTGQELQLNSLSAFASSYDSLAAAQAQAQAQTQSQPSAEMGFKPSYKLPEMETNFTPMQAGGSISDTPPPMANLPSTPMLMQYLPAQQLQDGGGTVQYLQLIPTRPIIVPISPFLTAAANAGAQSPAPSLTPTLGAASDYSTRGSGIQLSAVPANTGMTGLHYAAAGLQSYANAISPVAAYRSSYRINREAKDKNFPATFSLNMNEYLPPSVAGHDASPAASAGHPHTQLYIRARS